MIPLLLQVASVITLVGGEATTIVRNPAHEPYTITVELRERFVADGTVTVGRAINALVAPGAFTLAPGETQTVRIRLRPRAPVAPGTVLALVTTFTPTSADAPTPGSETTAVARIVLVTRLISKVVVR